MARNGFHASVLLCASATGKNMPNAQAPPPNSRAAAPAQMPPPQRRSIPKAAK
ncbi:hypothetical protein PF005_g4129 [Phytophthora fragariae]|uniref:Uncharacterized protein n=1 Tax=Phytophthora fragariae TaxID=53985 RepID=A0A6A3TKM2_9STRA|nr:hypothetical protein PF003_g31312 [Phytophthora fragariae]KAE8946179.1 hypothetical protein PF009_g4189 [Phytophthora fragariae]KAE8992449.1 hypothetical protein PF011_g17544 [Phytophthora fragariae]KAE9123391.1 hypothetical protein PF006_g17436 [Phytophthora fragariae]KAE9131694.1 hypothetical protein PF010_g3446 [Phytophthora fragariae]